TGLPVGTTKALSLTPANEFGGSTDFAGLAAQITNGSITIIPEPATFILAAAGLSGGCLARSKGLVSGLLVALYLTATWSSGLAAEPDKASGAAPSVTQFDSKTVADAFSKNKTLLSTPGYKVMASRRTEAGQVEVHAEETDVFYIVEGDATFITGGTVP